ncbi:MAG: hypothetical protein ACPGVB_11180, partial [Chitinophagales bacterium]
SQGTVFQTSDTLTQAFHILQTDGIAVHQGDTFVVATSVVLASNVVISRTTDIANSNSVINLLTFTACDCFTGWEGVQCTIPAPCDGVNCSNGGEAIEIDETTCECNCPQGFTGNLCEIEDKCALVTCNNNSTCQINEIGEAECVCDTGYEQPSCISLTRKKFLGNYNVFSDSCSTTSPYTLTIEEGESLDQIVFNSFNDFGAVVGKTSNVNKVTIQDTTDQMDIISSLEGSLNTADTTIHLLLRISNLNGDDADTCVLIMKHE